MGLHVFESLFEGAQRFFAGLFGEDFKSAIENLFGSALLAVVHETVHETGGCHKSDQAELPFWG